ncbi:MAG: hypothetical protein FJX76_07665 [Armatimonadetes bacterium]|nr:hypothetical protein [Armatimonadota bacterium]
MTQDTVASIPGIAAKERPAAAEQPHLARQPSQNVEQARTSNNVDAFTPSEDLDDELASEEKGKPNEPQQSPEDEKRKLLEQKIADKSNELEQARKSGDQDKIRSLTAELAGLNQELAALRPGRGRSRKAVPGSQLRRHQGGPAQLHGDRRPDQQLRRLRERVPGEHGPAPGPPRQRRRAAAGAA